jgi:hypothetical protein
MVESRWREKNYNEDLFPSIAAKALEEFDMPSKLSAWDAVSWALEQTTLPDQRDQPGRFGDPPITFFNASRFHIDVYFWLDGTTSIHQHAFCGAFQVMMGSSIHSHYMFDRKEHVNTFTEIGDINLNSVELLTLGKVREILPGKDFIHALFHLDQPSATICVRTHRSPLHLPQFDYRKPFLALDPFFDEPVLNKKLQSIMMLLKAKHPDADKRIAEMLEKADFQSSYVILANTKHMLANTHMEQFFNVGEQENRYEKMMNIVRKNHGELASTLEPVFSHQQRIGEITSKRGFITDPELRFFLALMLNVEGKDRVLSLVKERFPEDDPMDKTLDWVSQLSQTKVFGAHGNSLGIDDFNDFDLIILEDMMNGLSADEIEKNMAEQGGGGEDATTKIKDRIEKITRSNVLRPLLGN